MMNCLYQISNQNLKNENYYIFFLMTSNLLIWTKSEGFVYLISILVPLFFFLNIKINKKLLILFCVFLFLFFQNFYL